MTATDGAPALRGAAGPVGAQPAALARRPPRLRTVVGVATAEASLLVRSVLVLAGLLAGGAVIWILIYPVQPMWWSTAWQVGDGQVILGMAVLVAAQLAAGRARRDGMSSLYASFPVTAGSRTAGQLAGLAGAVPASLLLIGASVLTVQLLGAVGAPSITVLAAGLLLVIASGAAGIAIGTRFAHPLAGVLGAVVLFVISAQSYRFSGASPQLFPWVFLQFDLRYLPGPLAGYPPAAAHAAELAAIAILAGIVALAATARLARARRALVTAGIVAVAVVCLAGAVQLRPIPPAELDHLVTASADPASVQPCTTSNHVRYCLYPGFGSLLPALEAPVSGVLAHLPGRLDHPLTVSQVATPQLDTSLTYGQSSQQLDQWHAELQRTPAFVRPAAAIYLPVGEWPAFGGRLADARFDVALATAEWAVDIPLTSTTVMACVPLDQAREAIALWLAILAIRPPVAELQAGLPRGLTGVVVHNTLVPTWTYPGLSNGQVDELVGAGPPQTTEAGYLLARAMTGLPEQRVERVLRDSWNRWVNVRTTDAQLAAALGIRMPSVHVPQLPHGPDAGKHVGGSPPAGGTQNPVCTS
jgi:hypothetical protein